MTVPAGVGRPHTWCAWSVAAFVVSCSCVSVLAEVPFQRPADFATVTPRNTDRIIKLKTNTYIPDDGELNWQLFVPRTGTISDVRVEAHGIYHRYAGDLRMKLHHELDTATLIDGSAVLTAGDMQFGDPDLVEHPNFDAEATGTGVNFRWEDELGHNLALGKNTTQSSTSFGGTSDLAVDGNVNGYFSGLSTTHTGDHANRLGLDAQPYWEVDMNNTQSHANFTQRNIGTVRVWARQQEANLDEVQVITTSAAGPINGTFQLSLNWVGAFTQTTDISVRAVASTRDEDLTHDAGLGIGESMQSKLEALSNVGQVKVSRSLPDAYGGYSWTVTFLSEPGDLPLLQVGANDITSAVGQVFVRSSRNGTSSVFYNYKDEVVKITGSLVPSWIMLMDRNASIGDVSLDVAKAASVWYRQMPTDWAGQREITWVLPVNITGRFLRIQKESLTQDLSIAEVQVYEKRANKMSTYEGGSPVQPGKYHPETSLQEAFIGKEMYGHWTLSIEDLVAASVRETTNSRPDTGIHGRGALDSWALEIVTTDGQTYRYEPDVSAIVKTLPVYGTLYKYNATTGGRGLPIEAVTGQTKYLTECYDNCFSSFGVGCPFSTSEDGSLAVATNRILPFLHDRSVVYVPNTAYLGQDHFTYSVLLGTRESVRGTVTVHMKKCRVRTDCLNDLIDDFLILRRS